MAGAVVRQTPVKRANVHIEHRGQTRGAYLLERERRTHDRLNLLYK